MIEVPKSQRKLEVSPNNRRLKRVHRQMMILSDESARRITTRESLRELRWPQE